MFALNRQLSAFVYVNRKARDDGTQINRRPLQSRSAVSTGHMPIANVDPSRIGEFVKGRQDPPLGPSMNANTIFEEEDEASDF